MLVGRDHERRQLQSLLQDARTGTATVIVVTGEPGIGKTALLEEARGAAAGARVLAVRAVENESRLPYAGLSALLQPVATLLARLPPRRRGALESALGLVDARPGDRFAAYGATMSLLAEAAEQTPVVALVDDAHWLDAESLEALIFSARRFGSDPVCLIFSIREGQARTLVEAGFPQLALSGLDADGTMELLSAQSGGAADEGVAHRLHDATAGNPLALVELARLLTPAQLAGREPLRDPLPSGPDVERAFGARISDLPPQRGARCCSRRRRIR